MQAKLELARGYFDRIYLQDGELVVDGWILLPDKKMDFVSLYLDKKFVCNKPVEERDGVAQAFKRIPHAKLSGFAFRVPLGEAQSKELVEVCVVGVANGEEIARMVAAYSKEAEKYIPTPPTKLMERVANTNKESFFRTSAFKSYYDYSSALSKFKDIKDVKTMLDWGCGCGRLTNMFHRVAGIPEVHGCDIDAEAIEWCSKNIEGSSFSVIPLKPPTGYKDDYFDLCIGNSVLTHLQRDMQIEWLKEMHRILAPDGLFLASVHGEFAAIFDQPDTLQKITDNGIDDGTIDSNLAGIVPAEYYRGTFQSRKYTEEKYGKYFDVIAYVERGAINHQDLVLMKKVRSKGFYEKSSESKQKAGLLSRIFSSLR